MKIKSVYIAAAALLVICVLSYFNTFEKTESSLEDTFLQSRGQPDLNIKIIGIDDESLQKLGQWPWPRNYMAEVINRLSSGGAAVVGIDVMYFENGRQPGEDDVLAAAIQKAGNVVLPVNGILDYQKKTVAGRLESTGVEFIDVSSFSGKGAVLATSLDKPIDKLYKVSKTGHINVMIDSSEGTSLGSQDAILRKGLFSFLYDDKVVPSFDWVIYNEFLKKTGGGQAVDNVPLDPWGRFNVKFTGKPGDFEKVPFCQVYDGEIPPDYFKDSIVLIGPYSLGIAKDNFLTPLDHQNAMYGVEYHANVIQQFMSGSYKRNMPDAANLALLVILAGLGYLTFRKLSPALSAAIVAAYIVIHTIAAKFIYNSGYIIQLFYPAVLIIALYLIMLAYRYIEEFLERRRITGVFGRYVAPQIVDEIIKGGEDSLKLGGTRREISALFVDIRGFTPMSEKVQPEQVVEILNDYLNLTASSIFKFGGTLDKFIGDATMAIFNAPLDLDDHPFKAVQTAWAMKEGSLALQKGLEEKYGRAVQFGIGVNTGFAVVGNIGAKFRMDYTAIGDTVNTAARLESNAKPGQILISQATYDRIKDRILATPLGGIKVKGKEQELQVYQVDGVLDGNREINAIAASEAMT